MFLLFFSHCQALNVFLGIIVTPKDGATFFFLQYNVLVKISNYSVSACRTL